MYSSILIAPSLCPHAAPTAPGSTILPAHTFTYILSTPSFTLRLTSEPHPVLDTRLPKLQVGPLVAKRKTGSEAAKTASDAFTTSSAKLVQPDEAETAEAVPEEKKGMKLPGSAVLVKEDEPASVIAFTLS
jgi:1-phosphatidylinositol-3-phosphate 5-kinase